MAERDIRQNRAWKIPKLHREINPRSVKYQNAEKMAKEIAKEVLKGDRIIADLGGNFIFGDFIEALIVEWNLKIDELTITTLAMSKENVDSLGNLVKGDYISKLNLLISDYHFAHEMRQKDKIDYLYAQMEKCEFNLAVARSHTKLVLIRIGDKKIVINGSANLRSSDSLEEINIETNDFIYEKRYETIARIFEHYSCNKKTLNSRALFDII